jgi:Asp-tRNA(Asn)/Glu-tRNA(Gln) amidotransferase C subunit
MSKSMSLEILSSIHGAKESPAVNELFKIVKEAIPGTSNNSEIEDSNNYVTTNALRDDVVIQSSVEERQLIIKNFPVSKNGYLIVSKVIED